MECFPIFDTGDNTDDTDSAEYSRLTKIKFSDM